MTLLELADRCEREGPSFALDRLIMYAVYDVPPQHRSDGDKPKPYTTSLDAAVTLVPEGDDVFWRVGHDGEGPDPSLFKAQVLVCRFSAPAGGFTARADTAVAALCAAALRARSAV